MIRIAQVANFVAPHSGGIRTVLGNLAAGYATRGVDVVQIVPGRRHSMHASRWGTAITIPGVLIPKTVYRVIAPQSVRRALEKVAPDHRSAGQCRRRAGTRPGRDVRLAALEALAAGTPVVADERPALFEVLGDTGIAAAATAVAFCDAVQALLARPVVERRTAARARALGYSWDATVDAFLTAHGGARSRADR